MPSHVPTTGATLTIGGTDLGQIKSMKGPNISRPTYDITPISATAAKVFGASTCYDGGECSVTLMWDPTATTGNVAVLNNVKSSTTASAIVISGDELGNGTVSQMVSFTAFVTAVSPAFEIDGVVNCEVTMKVTGAVTMG